MINMCIESCISGQWLVVNDLFDRWPVVDYWIMFSRLFGLNSWWIISWYVYNPSSIREEESNETFWTKYDRLCELNNTSLSSLFVFVCHNIIFTANISEFTVNSVPDYFWKMATNTLFLDSFELLMYYN